MWRIASPLENWSRSRVIAHDPLALKTDAVATADCLRVSGIPEREQIGRNLDAGQGIAQIVHEGARHLAHHRQFFLVKNLADKKIVRAPEIGEQLPKEVKPGRGRFPDQDFQQKVLGDFADGDRAMGASAGAAASTVEHGHLAQELAFRKVPENLLMPADRPQDFDVAAEHEADAIGRVALMEKKIAVEITLEHHAGKKASLSFRGKTFPELVGVSVHVRSRLVCRISTGSPVCSQSRC